MTNRTARTLITAFAILGSAVSLQAQGGMPPGGAQPGRGGPMRPETKLVAQFDRDGDSRLNSEERAAAMAFLAAGGAGPGARGGRQGGGGGARAGGAAGGARAGGMGGAGGGPPGRGGGRGGPASPPTPGARISPESVKVHSTPLYDEKTLRTIFLTFENANWEEELAAFYNTDVEVPATAIVDGRTYNDVGVHFRGASSFMSVPAGSKRSLNLSFDFVHEDQGVGGYRTLNLLNSNGDPTMMRSALYSRISREYIAAPKVNFVQVVINGENWGVYGSAEQFNKDFLRDHYGTTEGARWKVPGGPNGRGGLEYLGDDITPYRSIFEIKSKDDESSWNALIKMTRVLNQTPIDRLEAELAPLLDIDGALKFLALDIALVNSDGYWVRSSDYNLYRDTTGRFHIIAHDMNETFSSGGGPGGGPPGGPGAAGGGRAGRAGGFPPNPPGGQPPPGRGGRAGGPGGGGGGVMLDPLVGLNDPTKPLISRLLAVPALRQRYLGYVRDIAERWLDWQTLEPIVSGYQSVIATEVERDTRKLDTYEAFTSGIAGTGAGRLSLKAFADARRAFLLSHPLLSR